MIGNIAKEVPTNLVRGNDTVWDDLRFPVSNIRVPGTNPASWETFNGFQVLGFAAEAVNEEQVFFLAQIPHGYKYGTDLEFHVHWVPETADSAVVRWGLEYEWANINGVFTGETTTIYGNETINDNAGKHILTDLGSITNSGHTLSSMLMCRLFRNSSSETDTFDDFAYLLEADFHYQIDQIGSRQEYVK